MLHLFRVKTCPPPPPKLTNTPNEHIFLAPSALRWMCIMHGFLASRRCQVNFLTRQIWPDRLTMYSHIVTKWCVNFFFLLTKNMMKMARIPLPGIDFKYGRRGVLWFFFVWVWVVSWKDSKHPMMHCVTYMLIFFFPWCFTSV